MVTTPAAATAATAPTAHTPPQLIVPLIVWVFSSGFGLGAGCGGELVPGTGKSIGGGAGGGVLGPLGFPLFATAVMIVKTTFKRNF